MLINVKTEENCMLHAYKTFNVNKCMYLNFDQQRKLEFIWNFFQ